MLRKTICTTLIAILMIGAASAQPNTMGLPGYTNSLRSTQDKKNDKELERAYQSTNKGTSEAQKNSDPWGDVRAAPPAAAPKKKQQ
jgi:hypothetical protein